MSEICGSVVCALAFHGQFIDPEFVSRHEPVLSHSFFLFRPCVSALYDVIVELFIWLGHGTISGGTLLLSVNEPPGGW